MKYRHKNEPYWTFMVTKVKMLMEGALKYDHMIQ